MNGIDLLKVDKCKLFHIKVRRKIRTAKHRVCPPAWRGPIRIAVGNLRMSLPEEKAEQRQLMELNWAIDI